jgi:hypothetical protein
VLLFEKKQELWLFGIGVSISVTLESKKFFGSFFQKRTTCCLGRHRSHADPAGVRIKAGWY